MRTTALISTVSLLLAGNALAGRYEDFCKKAQTNPGPPVQTVAATFLGSAGDEIFVGGGIQRDGSVVLVGQAVGPEFLSAPGAKVAVWGPDQSGNRDAIKPDKHGQVSGEVVADPRRAMSAGFVVRMSGDLQKVLSVGRFGFGVASAASGAVGPDGAVYVSGRCDFKVLQQLAKGGGQLASTDLAGAPNPKEKPAALPDAYVAKVAADGTKLEWVHVLRNATGQTGRLFVTDKHLVVDAGGLRAISLDGRQCVDLKVPGADRTVGVYVDPKTGTVLRGGDRNTNTGREPYRNPFLTIYDAKGNRGETLWNWDSKVVGSDKYRLVSDSSPRVQTIDPDGNIVIAGWSDGGNTVFNRQPKDLDATHEKVKGTFIDSAWGMNVGSLATILVIDPKTYAVKAGTLWTSFVPDDKDTFGNKVNKPNNASVTSMAYLPDGSLAISGNAATGITETADAWFRYLGKGRFGGAYFTVFTPDFRQLRFSSYMPGCEDPIVVTAGDTLLLIGGAKLDEDNKFEGPLVQPVQPKHAGGRYDGHVVLMKAKN
jgi:hypothetical protein